MRKMLSLLSIGMIVLAPVVAAAQSGATGGGTPGAGGTNTMPGSSGVGGSGVNPGSTPSTGSPTSPSASPSPSGSSDTTLSTITNQADCDKAGGDWQASSSLCQAKK